MNPNSQQIHIAHCALYTHGTHRNIHLQDVGHFAYIVKLSAAFSESCKWNFMRLTSQLCHKSCVVTLNDTI